MITKTAFQVNILTSIHVDEEDQDLFESSVYWIGYWAKWLDGKNVLLHKIIMERKLGRSLLLGELIDHKDRNRSNLTRSNLRLASQPQNAANNTGWKKRTLPHGVYKQGNRFRTGLKGVFLGSFLTPEEAFEAFKRGHVQVYGEFSPYYEEM